MPSFGMKGKGPKVEGDFDADLPKVRGDVDANIDANLPEADLKLKKPKASGGGGFNVNLPSFGLKGPKVEGDIDADLPKVKGDLDVDLPDADINLKKPKGSAGFHMPSFGMKGKGPKVEGDFDADLPKVRGDIDANIDANLPLAYPTLFRSKASGGGGFNVNLPSFGLKGPKVEGDIDADLPKVKGDLD